LAKSGKMKEGKNQDQKLLTEITEAIFLEACDTI
jgi:hypothetical protein